MLQCNLCPVRALNQSMEKLAFLERVRFIQKEVNGLRRMRERLALFGRKPKRLEVRLMLHRRMRADARLAVRRPEIYVGLLAAE
jgi:hypothetical protein